MISCIAESAIQLLDEKACRAWWLRRLHPSGPICPNCGVTVTGPSSETWASDGLICCRDCGKWFDCRTATPVSGLHLNWQQLTLYVTLRSIGLRTSQIARLCQISDDTVRRLSKRFGGLGA